MSEIIWLIESKSFSDPRTLSFGDYQHMGLSGKKVQSESIYLWIICNYGLYFSFLCIVISCKTV